MTPARVSTHPVRDVIQRIFLSPGPPSMRRHAASPFSSGKVAGMFPYLAGKMNGLMWMMAVT